MSKSILISFILFLAATYVAAQDAFTPFEGTQKTYKVVGQAGSSYQWNVYTQLNPLLAASSSAVIITNNGSQQVSILWVKPGEYYLLVTETDASGCTNTKAARVEVLPISYNILFTNTTSSACYTSSLNNLTIPVQVMGSNNQLADVTHFPIKVNYTINGVAQTPQSITYTNQALFISGSSLTANPNQDTQVVVAITGATDSQNQIILPEITSGQNIHTQTIYEQPQIQFAKTGTVSLMQGEQRSFEFTGSNGNTYQYRLRLPDGTSQLLPSTTAQSGNITFTQTGTYTLQVQATNEKGCLSEWVTKTIVVENPALNNAGVFAISDMNTTWAGMTVSGNVLTNDLFYDASLVEAKIVTTPLAESGKLTKFDTKTGDYTFVPASGYTGEAIFEYQICQKDQTGKTVCSTSNVSVKVLGSDSNNQAPVANNDVAVAVYNTAIKGNFLLNDFIPGTGNFSISQVRSSGLTGTLKWDAKGDFSYIPQNGFSGEEHFTYQICNGTGKCDWATVSIYVMSSSLLQNGLYANADAYYTEGQLTGSLSDNDLNNSGASLVYKVTPVTNPAHGTVQVKPDGSFTYTPQKGTFGQITDQFVVEACTTNTPQQCSKEAIYIVGNISKINLVAKSEIATGACHQVVLDASASTGVGALTYHWSPEKLLDNPTSSKPVFTPGTSTDFTLTVTDEAGNTATKAVRVKVDQAPQIVTTNQVFMQSASEVAMLDASASTGNNLKFNWSSTQGGVIVSGANTDKPQIKGIGKYYLQVTDSYGCTDLDSIIVGLYIHVKAVSDTGRTNINLAVDINVLANDIPKKELDPSTLRIVSPPSNGIATVVGDSLVSYLPNQYFVGTDNFVYSICDYFLHCDQATVLVLVNDHPFFIPEAFSPNGDGLNDKFEIKGLAKYKSVEIEIFNRWGNVVYQSKNYGEGQGKAGFWDGTSGFGLRVGSGPVPSGTYFYVLRLDGKEKINGTIYLDR